MEEFDKNIDETIEITSEEAAKEEKCDAAGENNIEVASRELDEEVSETAGAPDIDNDRYNIYGENGAYRQGGYGAFTGSPVVIEKSKKPSKVGKFFKFVGLAVCFGLIAGATFIGTSIVGRDIVKTRQHRASDKGTEVVEESSVKEPMIKSTTTATKVSLEPSDISTVVEEAMPSIVQINCTFNTQSWFGVYESSGAGSGIILKETEKELLIATNNHVVDGATTITITFSDDSTASASIRGTNAVADLAVVAVELESLSDSTKKIIKVAELGDSDSVKVGQMAIAIGNAMGYGTSTTVGYISAKDREVEIDGNTMILLQTDAAINPGNSGGALLNIKGQVIGINSVKFVSEKVDGMGFAIPISNATAILDELASREVLADSEKGYIGAYLQNVTQAVANAYGWPVGIYIGDFTDDSAAEAAGILIGDIVTAVNGNTVQNADELKEAITSHRAGTVVTITVQRLVDGRFEEMNFDVTLRSNKID